MSTRKASPRGAVKPCTTPACRRMKTLFSDWHDHILHWRTRRTLEVHLAGCPPCRVYFESLERTIVLVREWPGVEVPDGVRGHLRELLRERHDRRRVAAAPARGGAKPAAATGKRGGAKKGAAANRGATSARGSRR